MCRFGLRGALEEVRFVSTMTETLVGARFDDEDLRLLEACKAAEKLSTSDILRRAIRFYAKHLGVDAPPEAKQKRKR